MSQNTTLNDVIISLVQNCSISEQNELQQLLKEYGHIIPQATLSRRLKKLNIAKVAGKYTLLELTQTYVPIVLNVQVSQLGMIVLHTQPGNANSLAYYIDQKYVSITPNDKKSFGILGTLAGDDTVIVIIEALDKLTHILHLFKQDFPYIALNSMADAIA